MLIIAASGMATGGRVLHHLEAFAGDPKNLILLAGFQGGGTRGASLLAGTKTIRIHGHRVDVRAEVRQLTGASADADANELLAWMGRSVSPPKITFITHGEPAAADALRQRVERDLGWECVVPEYMQSIELTAGTQQ